MNRHEFAAIAIVLGLIANVTACSSSAVADADNAKQGDDDFIAGVLPTEKNLAGAYVASGEAPSAAGGLRAIAFDFDGTFFADFAEEGKAELVRVAGTYSVTASVLKLSASASSSASSKHFGEYEYRAIAERGSQQTVGLHVARTSLDEGPVMILKRQRSYCVAPVDCEKQPMTTFECIGHFTCAAPAGDEGAGVGSCSYECG